MADARYTPPLDPELARAVEGLDDEAQEHFQERAAIIETSCPGLSRRSAEAAAWEDTLRYLERREAGRD